MDTLRNWLDDAVPESRWSNRDLARIAIEAGSRDPKAVWAALALLDAAHEMHKRMPDVPFDDLCIAITHGLVPEHTLTWSVRYWWYVVRAWFAWRRVCCKVALKRHWVEFLESSNERVRRTWR